MFLIPTEVLLPFRFIFNLKNKENFKRCCPWIFNVERQGMVKYLFCVLSASSTYLHGEKEIRMQKNQHLLG